MLNLFCNVAQMHFVTRTSRAFNLETVAIEHVESQERLDKQEVHGNPDRTSPVTVASEQATLVLGLAVAKEGTASSSTAAKQTTTSRLVLLSAEQ